MPYNENLANRIRVELAEQKKVEEKKMMGGLTFMVNGKMCVGIIKDELMARIDPNVYEDSLERKGCHEMTFTGKPMKGFVLISPEGTNSKKDLRYWVSLALAFNDKARAYRKKSKAVRK